jgi:hypothetical protein
MSWVTYPAAVFGNQHVSIDTKKGACRTATSAPKPNTLLKVQALPKASGENQLLSSLGPEDCEPSVDPGDFRKGGVEVESEYDLELRIGGNVGRPGMGHSSSLTAQTVRW